MENQSARRRMNVITAQLASPEDKFAATHVFPMSCSNHLNSVIRRRDNRTNFARQGSCSQGFFMRQVGSEQVNYIKHNKPFISTSCGSNVAEESMFSKPAEVEPAIPCVKDNKFTDRAPDVPMFARPNQKSEKPQFCSNEKEPQFYSNEKKPQFYSNEKKLSSESNALKWSPRMDIQDSRLNYFVTLEIPGVSIGDIKVEVNNQSLILTGKPSFWLRGTSCSNEQTSSYHKKEISQGPFHVVWPLPADVNKENISAEIQDGLLHITIPKFSGLRWMRRLTCK